jgi:polyribonucleotide 5'-hydroxyl-kinase
MAEKSTPTEERTTFALQGNWELRVEVEQSQTASLKLVRGLAEIFGCELAEHKEYTISGTSVAVFTYHGAHVEVKGRFHAYVAKETPMMHYLHMHALLETKRSEAASKRPTSNGRGGGPRVIIVGPTDSGKSTLSRTLLSYATRKGREPIFVDLDVGQGQISIPGAIAAALVDRQVDVERGYSDLVPIVHFYGHTSPGENPKLYRTALTNLAEEVFQRLAKNRSLWESGLVINTCGWVDGLGFELIQHAVAAFEADVVLVLEHDRLVADLERSPAVLGRRAMVTKIPKSGGVVTRPRQFRRNARAARVKEYFYGPVAEFSPHTAVLDFSDITVLRIGTGVSLVPQSALPIGSASTADPEALEEVPITAELSHSILGVSFAPTQDQVLTSNIAGWICIQSINFERRKVTALSPCPVSLPGRFLLLASPEIKWLE